MTFQIFFNFYFIDSKSHQIKISSTQNKKLLFFVKNVKNE